MIVQEIKGDLFKAIKEIKDKTVVIAHCVNDLKIHGSGFVIPLFNAFPAAKTQYLSFHHKLDDVSYSHIGNVCVFNMCAQTGIRSKSTGPRKYVNEKPGRYSSLVRCMNSVDITIKELLSNVEIHIPKICSDRAGLDWNLVKELINEIWVDYPVYVYYL